MQLKADKWTSKLIKIKKIEKCNDNKCTVLNNDKYINWKLITYKINIYNQCRLLDD